MSDGWRFSPASQPAVNMWKRTWMDGPRDERNKWLEEFREQHKDNPFGMSMYNLLMTSVYNHDKRVDTEAGLLPPEPVNPVVAYCHAVESEPDANFEYMLEEGAKNNELLRSLADCISSRAAERICKRLFETENIRAEYIDSFFRNFLPIYLKRAYSWFSLDFMLKANKAYPLAFRTLLQILLQDLDTFNALINDFVVALTDSGKYEFLCTVMEIELTTEEFIHNLLAIGTAYKGAKKTEQIQNYIFNNLIAYSSDCVSDCNYGRLLQMYLHSISDGQNHFDIRMVERLVEVHGTTFKRSCKAVLNIAINALSEAAIPPILT